MQTINAILISFLGFLLLAVSSWNQRDEALAYLRPSWIACMPWLGWIVIAVGAGYLLAIAPGDIGLITWFGLHPILILAMSLLASRSFRALVFLLRTTPIVILLICLLEGIALASPRLLDAP